MFPPRAPFFKVLLNLNGAGKPAPPIRSGLGLKHRYYAVTASRSISGA
jgi:hypothetical protein